MDDNKLIMLEAGLISDAEREDEPWERLTVQTGALRGRMTRTY